MQGIIQAKLNVGAADDRFEREADRLSSLATGSTVRRAPGSVGRVSGAEGGVADPAVAQAVARARGGGHAVPGGVRERMERVSGADLSGVRMHVGNESDRLNDALGSRAFTVGGDVFVRRSEYRPGTAQGDALLGHELTHTIQQGAAPSSTARCSPVATPTAQRLFGLEFELRVPVFSRQRLFGQGWQHEAERYPKKKGETIAKATNFDVHVDHDSEVASVVPAGIRKGFPKNPAPIIELVTRPIDEFTESPAQVRAVMQDLVNVANHIRTSALATNHSILLDTVPGLTAEPGGMNYVGYPAEPGKRGKLSVDAYVQATFGLSLKRVGQEFQSRRAATGDYQADPLYRWSKVVFRAAAIRADRMIQYVHALARKDFAGDPDGYGTDADLEELHGLFTLMANYLLVGNKDFSSRKIALFKNRLGVFYYKTRLSSIRNDLVNADANIALLLGQRVDDLVVRLLGRTGRDHADPVVQDRGGVTCGDWVDSVLNGTGDQIFERSANRVMDAATGQRGNRELTAGVVGQNGAQGLGVVMENRRFTETEGFRGDHRYPPSQWPTLALNLQTHLVNQHGR